MNYSFSSRLGWYLSLAAIATEFTISGNLLTNLGSAYISNGGPSFQKVHPGSYLAILAGISSTVARLEQKNGFFFDWRLIAFLAGIAFTICYAGVMTGTGNIVVFVDTFLSAGMLALALYEVDEDKINQLRRLSQCLLVANACIALYELLSQSHLIAISKLDSGKGGEFRPTALYDHALTGGTTTMLGLWLVPKSNGFGGRLYFLLLCVAMFAFGERTPIAASVVGLSACMFSRCRSRILSRDLNFTINEASILPVVGICLLIGIYAYSDTRLGAHLYWDNSAQVRLSQFNILTSLDLREVVLGCPRDDLLELIEPLRLSSRVAVIENFWLVTAVTLGLLCFPVFVLSFILLFRWLWCVSSANGHIMIVLFVLVVSSSNSLGRKSTLLVTLIACVMSSSTGTLLGRVGSPMQAKRP